MDERLKTILEATGGSGVAAEFHKVGASAKEEFGAVSEHAGRSQAALGAIGAAAPLVGAAFAEMTKQGVEKFIELGDEVRNFQAVSGASAEDASRWIAVGKDFGIAGDTMSASVFKLTRNLESHADKLKADGIEVQRNSQGQLDVSKSIEQVAKAYQNTTDPGKRAQLVFDAFGKSGAAMIPILKQSTEHLHELYGEADKHHEILHQADVDKALQYKLAVHDLSEAFSGLERSVGEGIVPTLTQAAQAGTGLIDMADHATASVGGLAGIVGAAGQAFASAITFGAAPLLQHFGLLGHASKELSDAQKEQATSALQAAQANSEEGDSAEESTKLTKEQVTYVKEVAKAHDELVKSVSAALSPTESLQQAQKVFNDDLSTATDDLNAYKGALDAILGSYLSGQQASIDYATKVDALAKAVQDDGTQTGIATDKQRGLTSALIAVVDSAEKDIDAMSRDGKITDDAATKKQTLIQRLVDLEKKFPALKGPIDDYINHLKLVPDKKNTDVVLTGVPQAIGQVDTLKGHLDALMNVASGNVTVRPNVPGALPTTQSPPALTGGSKLYPKAALKSIGGFSPLVVDPFTGAGGEPLVAGGSGAQALDQERNAAMWALGVNPITGEVPVGLEDAPFDNPEWVRGMLASKNGTSLLPSDLDGGGLTRDLAGAMTINVNLPVAGVYMDARQLSDLVRSALIDLGRSNPTIFTANGIAA